MTGVVVEKNVNSGQEVRPDQLTSNMPPMFVITDPTRLWAQLDATEQDAALLHRGQGVTLRTPAYPGVDFPATITSIPDFVDPASRVIKIRATVDNADRRLKSEMFVSARIKEEGQETLMIPAAATFLVGDRRLRLRRACTGTSSSALKLASARKSKAGPPSPAGSLQASGLSRWERSSCSRSCKRGPRVNASPTMIERLVTFALTKPLFIVLGAVLFIGGGIAAFINLPIEAFPDISDTQVQVITLYPGRAAEEVENQVTIPLEVVLAGLPGSVRMFSHTQFGLSFMILTFDDTTNTYFARQQVVERLRRAPTSAAR